MMKIAYITDIPRLKPYLKEVLAYHKTRNYPVDWSRQWEYPWILSKKLITKKTNIADIGGGYSYFPCIIAKHAKSVTVYDKNPKSLNHCCTFTPEFNVLDISEKATEKQYDIVTCISVLEHIPNINNAIENLIKSVKVGGYLIITMDVSLNNSRELRLRDLGNIRKQFSKDCLENQIKKTPKFRLGEMYTANELITRNIILPNVRRAPEHEIVPVGMVYKKIL